MFLYKSASLVRVVFLLVIIATLLTSASAIADTAYLPQGLKRIEEEAFFDCTSLDEVVIPESVVYIGERAFGRSSVKTVHFPSSITFIADNAFIGVTSLNAYAPPGSYAAEWCKKQNIKNLSEETPSFSLSQSDTITMPSGTLFEGSKNALSGVVRGNQTISSVTISVMRGSVCVGKIVNTVNSNDYNLGSVDWDTQLLPTGQYEISISIASTNGEEVINWITGNFSIVKKSAEVTDTHTIDNYFTGSSSTESADLVKLSLDASDAVYNASKVASLLKSYGFNDVKTYNTGTDNQNTCGIAIGWKNIMDSTGAPKRLIAIILRGTPPPNKGLSEWIGDVSFWGDGSYHANFYTITSNAFGYLCADYIKSFNSSGVTVSDMMVWTTGHSRGAAAANLMAGAFLPTLGFTNKQVYCYTFACPNVKKGGNAAQSNIFNYIIGGDLFARLPLESWDGFGRFGTNWIFHNSETIGGKSVCDEESMTCFIEDYYNGRPDVFEALPYGVAAHYLETYRSCLPNGRRSGSWSHSYLVITRDPAPANFKAIKKTPTTITLQWDNVSDDAYYEIRYDKAYTVGWSYSTIVKGNTVTITDLEPNTNYAFDIASMLNDKKSKRSETIHASTSKLTLSGHALSNTSVALSWPVCTGASHYEVRFDKAYTLGWTYTRTISGNTATITGLEPDTKYAFDVCPVISGQLQERSETIHVTTPGLNLKCTGATATSITLSWDIADYVDAYEIRYDEKGTLGWRYQKTTSNNSITITGLEPNTDYAFDICVINDEEKSERSATIYASTHELKKPTNLRCTAATATSITLSWAAVSGADSYEIRYDKAYTIGWSHSKTTVDTSITITGLNPDTEYAFDVAAVQNGKLSERSSTLRVSTTELKYPAGFKGSAASATSVTLNWTAAPGADSYEIRYDEKGTVGWRYSKTTTSTSITISNLDPDTDYAFDICSIREGKQSGRSATIYVSTPSLNLRGTKSTATSVSLTWNIAAGVDSYEIRYDKKGTIGWRYSKTTTSNSITITGLDPDTDYAFDICAVRSGNKTARSETVYFSTLELKTPAGFKSTATTETAVTLCWTATTGATSYEIRYDKKNTLGWSYSATTNGTSITITGLKPGTAYAFDICAIQDGKKSSRSDTIYASTLTLKAPTGFKASASSEIAIKLSWNAANGASSYEIRYDKKGTIGWSCSKIVTGTSVTISGLNPGTDYAFDICSIQDGQQSGRSSTIYASTPALKVPSNFKSTGTAVTSVTLSWSPVNNATSYEIRYDKKGTLTWRWSKSTTATSITITGLDPNTAYAFDICAVRGGTKSSRSSTIYATTKKLSVPTNFKGSATSISSVTLSWTAVTGAASYEIRYDKKGTIGWSYSKTTTGTSITITGLKPDTAYAFDICSVKDGKMSSRSATIYVTTKALSVPSGFSGTSTKSGSVTLSWNAVSGATYQIRYNPRYTIGWQDPVSISGTSKTITGLTSGKTYAFQIRSVSGSNTGDWSSTIYVKVK